MKRYNVGKIVLIIVCMLTFVLPAIQDTNLITAQAAAAPTLSAKKKTLYIGYNTYNIKMKNLSKAAKITYKSSNIKIATVTKKGKVTPIAEGNAKITVTISQNNETYKQIFNVTVKKPYINIIDETNELKVGESFSLSAKVYGSKEKLQWKVSDSNIAKVNTSNGVLTALSKGTVTVTVSAGKLNKTCNITVIEPEKRELIISGSSEMVVGETIKYIITNTEEEEYPEWSLSNDNVEYYDVCAKDQDITALKAGTVTLIVKSDTGYGEKTIRVKDLKIIGNTAFGVSETSNFSLNSEQAYDHVHWTVEDESIAMIVENPKGAQLKGLTEGSTVLTVHYYGDNFRYTSREDFTVSVNVYVGYAPDFTIYGDNTIETGNSKTYQISLPQNTSVRWSSSDPSIATVDGTDKTAIVTAWKPGTITLTAGIGNKQTQFVITITGDDVTDNLNDTNNPKDDQTGNTGNTGNTGDTEDSEVNEDKDGPTKPSDLSKQIIQNGVIYELCDTYAYVVGVNKGTSSAVILSEIEGLPVTKISNKFGQNTSLKSVSWSGSTITLEERCFYNNSNLTSVSLQGGNIYIESSAFANCSSLSSVVLSGEVRKVGNMAFSGCTALTELTIPGTETIYDIGIYYGPFIGCSALKELRLESKVILSDSNKEQYFLYGIWDDNDLLCKIENLYLNMEHITTSRLLQYILSGNLRKLTLANTKSICSQFINFDDIKLEEIVLPDTLTEIPEYAFISLDSLRKINIPASVTKVGNCAFAYCNNLNEINVGLNRNRDMKVEEAFLGTKYGSIQGCYWNNAQDLLNMEEYNVLQMALNVLDSVKTSGADEYSIIKGCHDWIIKNTVYDYENYEQGTVPASAYREEGVFEKGIAVCDGYAKAFQILMDLAGIECYRVVGNATNGGDHAWNIVKLAGAYYQIDCTWDDPVPDDGEISYEYFLINDEQMGYSHEWDMFSTRYPSCPDNYTADDEQINALEAERMARKF